MSSTTHPQTAYKLLTTEQWHSFRDSGSLTTATTPLDKGDGYIHLSTAAQAVDTFEKYFKDAEGIVLVEIDLPKVEDIRWEASRGGQLFPHCYNKVTLDAVKSVKENVSSTEMKASLG